MWTPVLALKALLEALDEAALVFDQTNRCRGAGSRVAALLGIDPRDAQNQLRDDLLGRVSLASPRAEVILASLQEASAKGERLIIDPLELAAPAPRVVCWKSAPIMQGNAVVGWVDVVRDVTREREADEMAQRLDRESMVDPLTGLANRRRFEQECNREHRRSQRAWESYALMRFDIDGMAAINQAVGRNGGDELLCRFAAAIGLERRQYDMVARWENDEFAVLLPGVNLESARVVLERAVASIYAQSIGPQGLPVTFSAAAAVWAPPSAETADDVLHRVGAALRAARSRGVGTVQIDPGPAQWKDGTIDPPAMVLDDE
jgi:diguanylate cyclase (GGDEF)-like protein